MHKHFVKFYSPGTMISEETIKPIESWDVKEAQSVALTIKERHGATPYGFEFITKSRKDNELDSKTTNKSVFYYLGGKVETVDDIKKRMPGSILLNNMEMNNWDRVITNSNSWGITRPLRADDVVLNWDLK